MTPPRTPRIRLFTLWLLALAATAGAGHATADSSPARPNVLVIITDDQGYGDVGIHGNAKIRTPRLDGLAREGVRFSQFLVNPVCSPTRASLMTGRYYYRTGVVDTYLGRSMMRPGEVTVAEMLRDSGYRTGIFGKWHLGDHYPLRAIDQGFQEALVCTGGGLTQPSDPPGNTYFDPQLLRNGKWVKTTGYCTDVFTDEALRFISAKRRQPFFCYVAYNAPHGPLQVPDAWVKPYLDAGLDPTTAKVYAMVENVDTNVGRLLDELKRRKLDQSTLVVFLTDNGSQQDRYRAGLRGLKGTVYEGGIRVPSFWRWPEGFAGGRVIDRMAAHIDITPTVLEACRIAAPASVRMDGTSLLPLLQDRGANWPDRTLFFQWHRGDSPTAFRASATRTERFKLVGDSELYDLQSDPKESRNLVQEMPEMASQLRRAYRRWYSDVSTPQGYDPPRIVVGSAKENPVVLTRQDWRGPRAGWDATSLGFWEVQLSRSGLYEVTLRFSECPPGSRATFQLGETRLSADVPAGAREVTFPRVPLPEGPGRLQAAVGLASRMNGVNYLEIRRR